MQQTVSFLILVHIQVSIFAISDVYNASRKLLCTFCNGKTKWYIPSLKRNYLWYSSIDVILTRFYFTQFYSAIHVLLTFFFVWVLDDDKEFASENSRINLKCGMNKKIELKIVILIKDLKKFLYLVVIVWMPLFDGAGLTTRLKNRKLKLNT